jgi:hypothetical protein
VQGSQLREDRLVDRILPRGELLRRHRGRVRHGEADDFHLPLKVNTHGRFAMAESLYMTVWLHRRDALVIGKELREPGDVAHPAVRVVRADEQLLLISRAQLTIAGEHLEASGVLLLCVGTWRPGGDPVHQRLVIARASLELSCPPSCATPPIGFCTRRLLSGKATLIRRAFTSFVIQS